jgi:polyferredoxin
MLADVVLALHVAVVAFVIGGLVLIVIGNVNNWRWVNAWWFRLVHLGAIAVVVAEVWLGVTCPLTTLEMWLREQAHATTYHGSFIEHWLQRILYYDAPSWAFVLGYSLFGLIVLATWLYFPPVSKRRGKPKA